jgi:hypothetical protein
VNPDLIAKLEKLQMNQETMQRQMTKIGQESEEFKKLVKKSFNGLSPRGKGGRNN